MKAKANQVGLLSIGDELLIGQVINTNAAWLSEQLTILGLDVTVHHSIADKKDEIKQGLALLSEASKLVISTGGLGPTKDDVTKTALIDYFDDTLEFHEESYERLCRIMDRFGKSVNKNQKYQCELPAKAKKLKNDLGTAPGMYYEKGNVHYFFLPGVPFEMKHLFEVHIVPLLKEKNLISSRIRTSTVLTAGVAESHLEEQIADLVDQFPPGLHMSYLPGKSQVRLRLTSHDLPGSVIENFKSQIVGRLGRSVYGFEKDSLESIVGRLLLRQKRTLGLAESCTGGAISARITSVAGASGYFQGSIISYDNRIKMEVLGVKHETIEAWGAVSSQCVHEMVQGALEVLGVDVAVAISGIAGPTGGTPDKPVGLVYIGVGNRNDIRVSELKAGKSRAVNIDYFVGYALNLLRLFLVDTTGSSPD